MMEGALAIPKTIPTSQEHENYWGEAQKMKTREKKGNSFEF